MAATPTRLLHESEHGSWELVLGCPDPRLRGFVRRYEGYTELGVPKPVLRQQLPSVHVPLILNFGAGWKIAGSAGLDVAERRDSFVAGLYESPVYVAAEGAASCLQVDLTPIGAHLFLGVPMHELSNRVVDADDVLGRDRDLVARLEAAPSWEDRFALLDEAIASRIDAASRPPPEILWACGCSSARTGPSASARSPRWPVAAGVT